MQLLYQQNSKYLVFMLGFKHYYNLCSLHCYIVWLRDTQLSSQSVKPFLPTIIDLVLRISLTFSSVPAITVSKNHRIEGLGRNLCGSSAKRIISFNPPPIRDFLEQVTWETVQVGFEYFWAVSSVWGTCSMFGSHSNIHTSTVLIIKIWPSREGHLRTDLNM